MGKYRRYYITREQSKTIIIALDNLIIEIEKSLFKDDLSFKMHQVTAEQLVQDLRDYKWLRQED